MTDEYYMNLALQLAAAPLGRTWPNPMVGAVVVKDGRIVGMGAHLQAGQPHAEVYALNMAGEQANGATLYVTLEPCSHYGRTPPCADRVVVAGLSRVVIAGLDPNPLVSGSGAARLQKAGIDVEIGLFEQEAVELNEVFFHVMRNKRPFVVVKTAMTLDGKIATTAGDSRWISGEESRRFVHEMRDRYPAIMVGIGTILQDDPQLTVRLPEGGRNPVRVVIDTHLAIPRSARVLDTSEAATLIVCKQGVSPETLQYFQNRGVDVWQAPLLDGRVDLRAVLHELLRRDIIAVLVEGGATLNGSLLDQGLVDRVVSFVAPKLVGGQGPTPFAGQGVDQMSRAWHLKNVRTQTFGNDIAWIGSPVQAEERE